MCAGFLEKLTEKMITIDGIQTTYLLPQKTEAHRFFRPHENSAAQQFLSTALASSLNFKEFQVNSNSSWSLSLNSF